MTFRKLSHNHTSLSLLTAAIVFSIAGCGEDKYKGLSTSQVGIQSSSTGMTSEQVDGVAGGHGAESDPRRFAVKANPNQDSNEIRILKADLYYKFEWARRVLDGHVVPLDLPKVLEDVKSRSAKLPADRVSFLVKDIVGLLQDGLDADKLEQAEKSSPTEFVRSNSDKSSDSSDDTKPEKKPLGGRSRLSISTRQGERDRLIRLKDVAIRRHQSFSIIKWQKFEEAGVRTQELAHALGIQSDDAVGTDPQSPGSAGPQNPRLTTPNPTQ